MKPVDFIAAITFARTSFSFSHKPPGSSGYRDFYEKVVSYVAILGGYAAAIDHANHGRLDEAIAAFEASARVPMMRFQAGARLGRLHVARGDLQRGVEWLERAAQAPAPTAEDGNALLYELADALERLGEHARALAVLLELHADAGDYRDVAARIDRLSKVQAER